MLYDRTLEVSFLSQHLSSILFPPPLDRFPRVGGRLTADWSLWRFQTVELAERKGRETQQVK
jgi:hypothetical protein